MLTKLRRTVATSLLSLALLPATVRAQATYATFDSFLAAINGYAIDDFDDLAPALLEGPQARGAGTYAYTVQSGGFPLNNLYGVSNPDAATDNWLSVEDGSTSLSFGGFSNSVFSIGGRLFATLLSGAPSGTKVRVQAMDVLGNNIDVALMPASAEDFFGVRFDNALASFSVTADNSNFANVQEAYFATVNDLVVGGGAVPVPEPRSVWLLVSGLALLVVLPRRARSRGR